MSNMGILFLALLVDAAFGEPRWLWSRLPHPAVLMGRAVDALDRRLNHGEARLLKGAIATVFMVVLAWVLGTVLASLGSLVEIIVAAILLAQRSLVEHVRAVAAGLRISVAEGRRAVAMIVSRDTAAMQTPAIARSAIESASENLSDGVIAPAFWFAFGGLPGLLIYKVINTADSMIGYRTPRYEQFGKAAARLDDLLNWIPARATALLIALTGGVIAQWREIAADARLHRSPNAGWPEAAMSRAIGVALAGPRAYDGTLQDFPWVNASGIRAPGPAHIDAAISRLWRAWALMVVLCGLWAIL